MGLFSFKRRAGKKLAKKQAEAQQAIEKAENDKVAAMKAEIARLGIPVNGLQVELAEQVVVSGATDTNANREKVILALGNVDGVGSVEDNITVTNPEPEAKFYTVESGDSLSKISQQFYGDPMKYNTIFEANQPLIKTPDEIYPGQVLRIPAL